MFHTTRTRLLVVITLSMLFLWHPARAAGTCTLAYGQVMINEILPAPSSGMEWVELYNSTDSELDISGCYIDDIAAGGKAPVQISPGTTIAAHGFWVFETSDYFNNSGDDARLLSDDALTVLDAHTYGSTATDHSWYRSPDGGEWSPTSTASPTKGLSNSGEVCGTGTWQAGNLEIHHIDVGQGDSTLIVGPTGKSLLFDAAESEVGQYIEDVLGCRHLDYVVISHFHEDHIGSVGGSGLWNLVDQQGFTVGTTLLRNYNAYLGESPAPLTGWKTYLAGAGQGTLHPVTAVEGTSQVDLGPNVVFDILTVDGNQMIKMGDFSSSSSSPSENDYSVGARISYHDFDEWIAGDLDGLYIGRYHDIETSVAAEVGDVDIYRVHHHGSEHSTNDTFLAQLDPEVSIISVGDGNGYDHPKASVVARLADTSVVYLTERGQLVDTSEVIIGGNIVVKTADGIHYTVNGTDYTASEPLRVDADADGYFEGIDPNDDDPQIRPALNGGCDPDYQVCGCAVQAGQVLINEILPAPVSGTEWVELYNTTGTSINLEYCFIDDIASAGGSPRQIPSGSVIPANGFWVMDDFSSFFNNGGDDVRLLSGDQTAVLDAHSYGSTSAGFSWYRDPDGGPWSTTPTNSPTKGTANSIPDPPGAPILLSPANNGKVTGYTPTLTWKDGTLPSGSSIDHYHVQAATDIAFSNLVLDENTALAQFTFVDELLPGTKYYWHVQAYDTFTQSSPWSTIWSFNTSTILFDNGVWWVKKADFVSAQDAMTISVNGVNWGSTKLLQFGHLKSGGGFPEAAVIYNTGYVRLTPLGLPYGTSFILGPAHWDGNENYFHNLQIIHIDIDTSAAKPSGPLQITITARDYRPAPATDYHFNITHEITLPDPTNQMTSMIVTQTHTAVTDFTISSARQSGHQGFKWVQFSSMYIDGTQHDSDSATYTDPGTGEQLAQFGDIGCDRLIFDSPSVLDEYNPWAQLRHADNFGWQGNTPNTIIRLNDPVLATHVVPQGYVNCTADPNDDNLGFWLNHESAPASFTVGQMESITYSLIAQDNPMLAAPGLLLPTAGENLLTNRPAFDWRDVTGALKYNLQVSNSSSFKTLTINTTLPVSTYTPGVDLPRSDDLYWRVRTIGANGSLSDWSVTRTFFTADPPPVPILRLPAPNALLADYTPTFAWTTSGTLPQKYILQVDNSSDFSDPEINEVALTNPSFTPVLDLAANTKYYWRVRAVNALGEMSNWTVMKYFRTKVQAPTLVSPAESFASMELRPFFDWDPPSGLGAITGYTIQISKNNLFTQIVHTGNPVNSFYTPTADLPKSSILVPQLYWRVLTKGTNGPSLYSDVRSFTTPTNPSVAPVLLLPAANALVTDYTPSFSWKAVVPPAGTTIANYIIQIDDNAAFSTPSSDTSATTSFTPISDLPSNIKLYWRVRAVNNLGELSNWSTVRYFRSAIMAPVLSQPLDNVTGVPLMPLLDWESVDGNAGYVLQVWKAGTTPVLIKTVTLTKDSSQYRFIANLLPNTTYFWKVQTKGLNGPSLWSEIFHFTTGP